MKHISFTGLLLLTVPIFLLTAFVSFPSPQSTCHSPGSETMVIINSCKSAVIQYKLANGKWPDQSSLIEEGYIRSIPEDEWGNAISLAQIGKNFIIKSYGVDGKFGGKDIIEEL